MIKPKVKAGTQSLQYHSKNQKWFLDELHKHTKIDIAIEENKNMLVLKIDGAYLIELLDNDWIVVYPGGMAESWSEYEYTERFDSA